LESVLQRLSVLLVGRIFDNDRVVTFAELATLLSLALLLLWDFDKSGR
jgi:hypothetical protein